MILQNRQSSMVFSRLLARADARALRSRQTWSSTIRDGSRRAEASASAALASALNDSRTRYALEVRANVIEPKRRSCSHAIANIPFLPEAELHHEPTSRLQRACGGVEHAFDGRQAFRSAEQRGRWLLKHASRERRSVSFSDVGRVRDDQIESIADAREMRGFDKRDARVDGMCLRVLPRHRQRGRRDIRRRQARAGNTVGEADREVAAAGADVRDPWRVERSGANDRECLLDDQLGLRSGNEHCGRDVEVESPELIPRPETELIVEEALAIVRAAAL